VVLQGDWVPGKLQDHAQVLGVPKVLGSELLGRKKGRMQSLRWLEEVLPGSRAQGR
jgi:hypothetical protein